MKNGLKTEKIRRDPYEECFGGCENCPRARKSEDDDE